LDLLVLSKKEYNQAADRDKWQVLETLDVPESKYTYVCVKRKGM
jgi:hypothetical protein